MARIRASDAPRKAANAPLRWGMRFAEAAAVLAFVSGVAWWAFDLGAPSRGEFETLTTERPAASQGTQLRLEFARGVPEGARAGILAPLGLRIDAPPTTEGVYTIALPPGADARALAGQLRADPRVAFVSTPEPGAP